MVMESKDGRQGSSKSRRSEHQPSRGSSSVVGGGLVVGIATVVVVGVAGKLFSKLRKPNGSANNNTPYVTPTDFLDTIIHEENSDLPVNVRGGTGPQNEDKAAREAVNDGKSDNALDLLKGGSYHNDTSTTSDRVDHLDSAHSDVHTESSPQDIISSKSSSDQLHSDDSGFLIHQQSKEEEDYSTPSAVVLSQLVNQALLDAKQDSHSKHELLSKTNLVLQDGIAGVISRAFEDFSYGDTSSDEMTPTKVKLRVSWETNSSSGSEEEAAQVHPGELSAGSAPGDNFNDFAEDRNRINWIAPISEDEEVTPESLHSSSAPFQEQEEEPHGTITAGGNDTEVEEPLQEEAGRTGGNETEVGEPLHEEAGSSVGGNESTSPEVVPAVQKDKIEPENLVGVLAPREEEIKQAASLLDEVVKKETTSQECDDVQKHGDQNELQAEVAVKVTSTLLRSTESSSTGITVAKGADSVQISTHIADNEGTTVAVTSLVLPASSREITNITEIVAAKESTIATGIRKAAVVTDVELISNTGGGLKRELEDSWRGSRFSLEVLGLTVIVALIAVLIWSIRAYGTSSVPRL